MRIGNLFIHGSLAFISMFIVVLLYWTLAPYNPLTVHVNPMPIENESKTVKVGKNLAYYSDTCRNYKGQVDISRTLVSEDVLITLPSHSFLQDDHECVQYVNQSVVIPPYTPAGTYTLEINSTFHVNPLRQLTIQVVTEEFNVIE